MNHNYWAPLTSQVEELDATPPIEDEIIQEKDKETGWKLPINTVSKVRRKWSSILLRRKAKRLDHIKRDETILQMINQTKEQKTAVFDSGVTSHCGQEEIISSQQMSPPTKFSTYQLDKQPKHPKRPSSTTKYESQYKLWTSYRI